MNQLFKVLYNKKYSRGSLYGMGIFPFWLYVKYFGRPVFRKSRRLGLNGFFSLMAANSLGSAAHVRFFYNLQFIDLLWFALSLIIFTSLFYLGHKFAYP